MKRFAVHSASLIVMMANVAVAADVKSGLQPGDVATPFEVKDVTGPNKGATLCYR